MRSLVIAALLITTLGSARAHSQSPPSLSEASYTRARHVLERGIAATGGASRLKTLENLRYLSKATVPEVGQSRGPDAPYFSRPLEGEGVVDLEHRRIYQLRRTHFLGSGIRATSVVITGNSGFTADLRSGAVYPLAPPAVAAANRSTQRAFPVLLLQTAVRRAASLRWAGVRTRAGVRSDAISFSDVDGSLVTLCFDRRSGLLSQIEALSDNFIVGWATSETAFSDYRMVDGVRMPFHVVTRLENQVTSDLRYSSVAINTHPPDSLFDRPKGAIVGPEVGAGQLAPTVRMLAKDVYYVNAIETGSVFFYSSMFVAFNDYVLVVEAPLSDAVSQAVIAKIKETVPGKPIRYLVPTHYHVDHLGGIRGYVAEGSTIVTTQGNRRFVELLSAVAHPLNPDRLSAQPRVTSIETFERKRVFSDSAHLVELYNIGPTPHVDEMVMVYLPREKLVFVSDLFLVSYLGGLGEAEPVTVAFADAISKLGLQIETIAGGHGRIGTIDDLRLALQARSTPPGEP